MRKPNRIVFFALMLIVGIAAFGLSGLRPAAAIPTDPCDWASSGDADLDWSW
jgi:hypothetical protein